VRRLFALVLVLAIALPAVADAQCANCGLLKAKYNFNLRGQAVVGAATSGTCSQTGSVAAAFTSGGINFDGHGNITPGHYSGVLSIGATSCTFFGILGGTYTVENRGDGTFEATGVMNFQTQNAYSPCGTSPGNLALGSQSFVVTGDIGGKEISIATYGADPAANYAEGTGAGITCQAPIQNFITSGTGKEISDK
jgi:hypothetical protein